MEAHIVISLLAIFHPSLLKGQETASPSSLPGPCRSWLIPCGNGVWTCTTEENYWSSRYGQQLGCPSMYPLSTAPPPGDCQMVDGECQFTNVTLECTTWLNTCQGYQCGTVSEYDAFVVAPGTTCSYGSQYPQPDELCLPINDTCQWYNPCRTWEGFCSSGYNCGTADQYYQFRHGPQPLCALPPPGWVPPDQPGECAVMNGQCDWYNCTAWLDWCQTSWLCGTQYEEQIYRAGPIPACPAPPPWYRSPAQPGSCQFDVLAGQCEFVMNSTTHTAPPNTCPDGSPMVTCFDDPCRECPNYPNARCEVNYCGGCNAVYYDERGNNVTDQCGTTTSPPNTCPDGSPVVICFDDPCRECPNYPNARCEVNYCGGCHAVYYDERSNNVTDQCGTATSPPNTCPDGSPMVTCFDDPCRECPNYPNARCEVNYCGDCHAVYYNERGNNVTDYCRTHTGCEVILCAPGYKCIGNPVTGSAYCDPSCDEPYVQFTCGDARRCTLIDGNCPLNQTGPCPHQVHCQPDPCAVVDCSPGSICRVNSVSGKAKCLPSTCSGLNCSTGYVCEIDNQTGVAMCVGSCAVDNGGCKDYQVCSVHQYNYSWCYPSPCQHTNCQNAPYVSCSSTNVRAKCVANSRCLVQNKTQQVACVQSCFENNGGCDSDQVCVNAIRDCNNSPSPYHCTSQLKCLNLDDLSPTCPAGWVYQHCGTNCGSTCMDVLAEHPVVCAAVCSSGCFCPRGLVVYRDRCVDPKECFVLLNNPPAPNPLPLKSTTVLLSMTIPSMTIDGFKNKTQQFLNALQQLVQNSGYSQVVVTIHAVYFNGELQVVVQLSGNQISAAVTSELVKVVNSNVGSLPVQVKNVSAVRTQTLPTGTKLSVAVIASVVIIAVLGLLIVTAMVLVVMLVHKHKASKRIRQQQLTNDMTYSKLTSAELHDEEHDSITKDVADHFQEEKKPL